MLSTSILGPHLDSHLRDPSQFGDRSLLVNEQDEFEITQNAGVEARICRWLERKARVHKGQWRAEQEEVARPSTCYMLQIHDIVEVAYRRNMSTANDRDRSRDAKLNPGRKQEQSHKVYAKLVANLLDPVASEYSTRTVEMSVIEMEQKSATVFEALDNNLALFFHTRTAEYRVRIEVQLYESVLYDGEEIVQFEQNLGYADIDPYRSIKNKQKVQLYSPRLGSNTEAQLRYSVLASDSFKILEKLVPADCLVSSEDEIAGLAGRKLPNSINSLHYQVEYTDLHSLRIDVVSLDLAEASITARLKECEEMSRYFNSGAQPSVSLKQVRLEAAFHNGWTKFASCSARMEEKMDIQKKYVKKMASEPARIKRFTSEEACTLPFVFLDEEALIIMQVVLRVEVKTKGDSQAVAVPLCYGYYTLDRMNADDKKVLQLLSGDGATDCKYLDGSLKKQSGNKMIFYVNFEHANKMNLSKHLVTPAANRSHTEIDRIAVEKERIIKENKKLRHQNRLKKIELNSEIPILDTTEFKKNLYGDELERIRQQRREKEEILAYLSRKVQELLPDEARKVQQQDEDGGPEVDGDAKFRTASVAKKFYNSIFYKAVLENSGALAEEQAGDTIRVQPFMTNEGISTYAVGQVPLEVIKTELMEKNYCYSFFINWVTLLPSSSEKKLPRTFTFWVNFYDKRRMRSCPCMVNQMTGEVEVDILAEGPNGKTEGPNGQQGQQDSKQDKKKTASTEKVMYFEVNPSKKMANSDSIFIDFMSYMYHGEMQIKIIDANSHLEFGECFITLRDLIRMRRNEVALTREVWVRLQDETKARLKMQIRVMRKEATQAQQQGQPSLPNRLEMLVLQPQARQLQRIEAFKRKRTGEAPGEAKIQKILSEELTREEIQVKVSRMKGQFIKINVTNRKNHTESYRLNVNDPDRPFLINQELVLLKGNLLSTISQAQWWNYLNTIDRSTQKILQLDQSSAFDLNPGQTGTLLLYYYSERKYDDESVDIDLLKAQSRSGHPTAQPTNTLLRVYNRNRCVDITLSNANNGQLSCLYKLNLIVQPDCCSYDYSFTRTSNSKALIQVPYPASSGSIVYIDDPTVVSSLNQVDNMVSLDSYVPGEGECKRFNVSLLSPYPDNRMLINYSFEFWGAEEVSVECGLWESKEILLDFNSSLCLKKEVQHVLVLSSDEAVLQIRDRNLIKVNHRQAKTAIKLKVTSVNVGTNYYQLNVLSPHDGALVHRYSVKVVTEQAVMREKITLRLRQTDKVLEEPFSFRNEQIRKQRFRVVSTRPHLLAAVEEGFEVEARVEKRIRLRIDAEQVQDSEEVVLSLLGDRECIHYLFLLQMGTRF